MANVSSIKICIAMKFDFKDLGKTASFTRVSWLDLRGLTYNRLPLDGGTADSGDMASVTGAKRSTLLESSPLNAPNTRSDGSPPHPYASFYPCLSTPQ
eukprot:1236060-Pyramimonas_sp.AAC.1